MRVFSFFDEMSQTEDRGFFLEQGQSPDFSVVAKSVKEGKLVSVLADHFKRPRNVINLEGKEVKSHIESAVARFVLENANADLAFQLLNGLLAQVEQFDAEGTSTEATRSNLYSKEIRKNETNEVMAQQLSIFQDVEGDNISSRLEIPFSVHHNEDILLLTLESMIDGVNLRDESCEVVLLIFRNEAIGDLFLE